MAQRNFRVVVELEYTANSNATNDILAEELKRCRQSFQGLLKERGVSDVRIHGGGDRRIEMTSPADDESWRG